MKSAKFVPTATDYESVQNEAVAFYRAQKSRDERSDGQVSRLAATAAKRWEKSLQRPADVVDFSVADQDDADRISEILRGQGYAAGGASFDGRSWLVRTNAPEAIFTAAKVGFVRYQTREVLAAAYVRGDDDRSTLTHSVAIAKGFNDRPLCSKVKAASIADEHAGDVNAPPTCPTCLARDPRFAKVTP